MYLTRGCLLSTGLVDIDDYTCSELIGKIVIQATKSGEKKTHLSITTSHFSEEATQFLVVRRARWKISTQYEWYYPKLSAYGCNNKWGLKRRLVSRDREKTWDTCWIQPRLYQWAGIVGTMRIEVYRDAEVYDECRWDWRAVRLRSLTTMYT